MPFPLDFLEQEAEKEAADLNLTLLALLWVQEKTVELWQCVLWHLLLYVTAGWWLFRRT